MRNQYKRKVRQLMRSRRLSEKDMANILSGIGGKRIRPSEFRAMISRKRPQGPNLKLMADALGVQVDALGVSSPIRTTLAEKGMRIKDFAEKTGQSIQGASELIRGFEKGESTGLRGLRNLAKGLDGDVKDYL